jgi:hypothetical protein
MALPKDAKQFSIYLARDKYDALRAAAAREGVPKIEVVRRAIGVWLDSEAARLRGVSRTATGEAQP